jgi:hypothetical protein
MSHLGVYVNTIQHHPGEVGHVHRDGPKTGIDSPQQRLVVNDYPAPAGRGTQGLEFHRSHLLQPIEQFRR